jgi:hypothetical protein
MLLWPGLAWPGMPWPATEHHALCRLAGHVLVPYAYARQEDRLTAWFGPDVEHDTKEILQMA